MLSEILLIAIAAEDMTFTFMKGSIFDPLKNRMRQFPFLNELISCFLCLSFWTSLAAYGIFKFNPVFLYPFVIHAGARYVNSVFILLEQISFFYLKRSHNEIAGGNGKVKVSKQAPKYSWVKYED